MRVMVAVGIGISVSTLCLGQVAKIFGQPEKACALLETEGFRAGMWERLPHGFECIANRPPPRAGDTTPRVTYPLPAGVVVYMASGDRVDRIRRMKLVVQLPETGSTETLVQRFEDSVATLLKRIGAKTPKDLRKAIHERQPFRQVQAGARITFDPGRRPYTLLTFTLRDPRVRVETIPRVARQ